MKIKFPFFSKKSGVVCTTKQVYDEKSNGTLDKVLENKGGQSTNAIKLNGRTGVEFADRSIRTIAEQANWTGILVCEKVYGTSISEIEVIPSSETDGLVVFHTSFGDLYVPTSIEHDVETDEDKIVVGVCYYRNTQYPEQYVLDNILKPLFVNLLECLDVDDVGAIFVEEQGYEAMQ